MDSALPGSVGNKPVALESVYCKSDWVLGRYGLAGESIKDEIRGSLRKVNNVSLDSVVCVDRC